jgi:hypothetical protein
MTARAVLSHTRELVHTSARTGGADRSLQKKLDDVLSVSDIGVRGDGVTDDTSAFADAIAAAAELGRTLFIPSGLDVRVTDTIIMSSPVPIVGAGQHGGGAKITLDTASANKPLFRLALSTGNERVRITDILLNAARSVAGQHAIAFGGRFHWSQFERMNITGFAGRCFHAEADTYGQNIAIRDIVASNVGGFIGSATSVALLVCSLLRLDNIACETAINTTAPSAYFFDLRQFREITAQNICAEGAGSAGTTGVFALASNRWNLFDGVHIEYSSNSPTYAFVLRDSTEGFGSGVDVSLNVRGLNSELPIRIDSAKWRVNVRGWNAGAFTSVASLLSTSLTDGTSGWYADLETISSLPMSVPLNWLGRVRLTSYTYSSDDDTVSEFGDHPQLEWTPGKGWLDGYRGEGGFARVYFGANCDSSGFKDDATEGRVFEVACSSNGVPEVIFQWDLPSAYAGAHFVTLVKYRYISTDQTPSPGGFNFRLLRNSTVTVRATDNDGSKDGTWQWARGQGIVNSTSFLSHSVNLSGSVTATVKLQVAAVRMVLGRGVQQIGGGVKGSLPMTWWGSAAPTYGDYKRGDRVLNSAPSAAGTEGWVCTTAGSPGTWKTFGSIAS